MTLIGDGIVRICTFGSLGSWVGRGVGICYGVLKAGAGDSGGAGVFFRGGVFFFGGARAGSVFFAARAVFWRDWRVL